MARATARCRPDEPVRPRPRAWSPPGCWRSRRARHPARRRQEPPDMATYRRPPAPCAPRPGAAGEIARLGAVMWPSFFAAGVATMVFFAVVDPTELAAITWPQWTSRAKPATPWASSCSGPAPCRPAVSPRCCFDPPRRSRRWTDRAMSRRIPVQVGRRRRPAVRAKQPRSTRAKSTGASSACAPRRRVLAAGHVLRLPWINWGGRQMVLFDLPARRF